MILTTRKIDRKSSNLVLRMTSKPTLDSHNIMLDKVQDKEVQPNQNHKEDRTTL